MSNPTAFLTSMARYSKKWMIFGLSSHFPCAAFFKSWFENLKIFRENGSKIAGSKLQLVPFDTSWYNKLIPQTTFFYFTLELAKTAPAHLPTCPPAHLKHLKPMSALMFCVKNHIFRFKMSFFNFGCRTPKMHPWGRPLGVRGATKGLLGPGWGVLGCHQLKKIAKKFLSRNAPNEPVNYC